MRTKYEQMIKDFSSLGIELSDKQIEQFDKYYGFKPVGCIPGRLLFYKKNH